MKDQLTAMSEDDFEKHKEALASQKMEQPKRLSSQFSKLLNEISLQQYHFDRTNVEVAILKAMNKEEVMEYYKVNFIFE